MNSKFCHDSEMTSRRSGIESLMMKCPSAVIKHIMFIRLFLPEKGNIIAVILVLINGQTQENNFAGKNVCYYLFSEVLDNGKRASKNWTQNKAFAH